MRLIDEQNAADYLRQTRRVGTDEPIVVRELDGGVSNMVLYVERSTRPEEHFVLKQARGQLRTSQPWFSSVERIWREAEVLKICTRLIGQQVSPTADTQRPTAVTPRILFEDRDNYLIGMTAAPLGSVVWKAELLAGRADAAVAAACGRLLATLHGGSWLDGAIAAAIGDRTLFNQLRVDPYYRTLAIARPETRGAVERLVASLAAHPRSLVHADFSPKNLLVFPGGLMMVDFETGHFGDPAFDLGFFLSHLVLKACYHAGRHGAFLDLADAFYQAYSQRMASKIPPDELAKLWARGIQNLAGCAWARLDGKSPVEYLADQGHREQIRALCRRVFDTPPADWPRTRAMAEEIFTSSAAPLSLTSED
jgi:5-methylthioribose kinase